MLAEARFRALGTGVHVVTTGAGAIDRACAAVDAELRAIDDACSRFRDDSEVRRLEQRAGTAVPVSPLLAEAIAVALSAARLTDGILDPTVGALVESLGYDRDFSTIIDGDTPLGVTVSWHPAWRDIVVSRDRRSVSIPPGVRIDLGSTAKALAADRAAVAAAEAAHCGVLVNLGGDIALGGEAPGEGWAVRVTDDHAAPLDGPGETVVLHTGALATSSITVRAWRRGAEVLHHLVDPRTGRPADGPYRTVSVAAASCVDGNIAASAAVILGAGAPAWLRGQCLPARLVCHDGVVERTAGWPSPVAEVAG